MNAPAAAARSPRWWTNKEIALLREHYPARGPLGCAALLPGRTAASIYNRAQRLGVADGRWRNRHAHVWEPHQDEAIKRAYAEGECSGTVTRLAVHLGRGTPALRRRAMKLGVNLVPRTGAKAWTAGEDAILAANPTAGLAHLHRKIKAESGIDRSLTAIAMRLKRMRLSRVRDDPDRFNGRTVAELMGCNPVTVRGWVDAGLLKAKGGGQGRPWAIKRNELRKFLIGNVGRWDHRKCDRHFLVDILQGPRLP